MSTAISRESVAAGEMSAWERFARWRRRHRQPIEAWLMLSPILLYYSFFFLLPVIANLIVSFTRWSGVYDKPIWVGIANYKAYLVHPYPLTLFNTALFTISILLIQTTVAFLIAVLLNQKVAGLGLYRALWYVPTLTSSAITAQVFFAFISPYDGILNAILKAMGRPIVIWTISTLWMRTFVIVYSIWRGVGTPVVLFLAALQGIHPEIYEAAMVDGARGRDLLRYITVPLLRPMIVFVLITGMIAGFQIFETVMLITAGGQSSTTSGGGPFYTTNVVLLQIYRDAFVSNKLGMASAGSVITAIILLWFSTTNMRLMSRGRLER